MADPKFTSTSVNFGKGDADDTPIVIIEKHDKLCPNAADAICIRIYPDAVFKVRTSVGEVKRTDTAVQEIRKEFLRFTNSDEAQTSYPLYGLENLDLSFAFDEEGNQIGAGSAIFPSADPFKLWVERNDNGATKIKCSRKFFGVVKIEYFTKYRLWEYRPGVEEFGSNLLYTNGDRGYKATFGTIAAFYKGTLAMYDVGGYDVGEYEEYKEAYRVVSRYLVNENGAWEKPEGWPGETWVETGSPDPSGGYQELQRVHELGLLQYRSGGRVVEQRFAYRPELPKLTNQVFAPRYLLEISPDSSFFDTDFEGDYSSINWDDIITTLQVRYPRIELPEGYDRS